MNLEINRTGGRGISAVGAEGKLKEWGMIMSIKYKFVLTLPGDIEVDSAEEIDGHMSWPNYSQADPVFYKGIFDSYEEAKEYATSFNVYKYILNKAG